MQTAQPSPGSPAQAEFSCEQVARAVLGRPAKREGAELLWRCPHLECHNNRDAHPSLRVNVEKDVWLCGPCGASGIWRLRRAVSWLRISWLNRPVYFPPP